MQKHARLFAVLESMDNGKTIRESRDIDVPLAIRHFYYHAGWATLQAKEFPGHEPLGVAGQIIPWNFPLLMLAWKVAPAIAMGNTVVLKPAEQTPLTALLFARICQDVGLPKGVVNIVTGDGSTGAALVDHPDVNKIAFTGSTAVGKMIRERTAGTGKSLTLELGGKSPFIVFDDADLDSAVEGIVDSIWFNQGQVCCAGSRLLAQEGIAESLYAKLAARLRTLRVGDPLDKNVDMGPIVSAEQLARIRTLVAAGCSEGATLTQAPCDVPSNGHFYPPTLLTNVEPAHLVAQEEIFGPVLVAMTFRTPGEAVEIANHTRYGLAASVWTENVNLALDMAPKLRAGVVWVNSANLFDAAAGFGGVKESGYGREGGREGLYAYLKPVGRPAAPKKAGRKLKAAAVTGIDRTPKLYIGGKQVRPDAGYSIGVIGTGGVLLGHVGQGNRKDVRNAVEAARRAAAWSGTTGYARSQVLYFIAENLAARRQEFEARIMAMTGQDDASSEVDEALDSLFTYAAWADKHDGAVHSVPMQGAVLAMNEATGVIGIVCPADRPLAGLIDLVAPAIATGNRVIAVPSEAHPLSATDLYQVFDTSDLPDGVVNIVTGEAEALAEVLALHNDVDALWYAGPDEGRATVERASIGNLKRVWLPGPDGATDGEALRQATQVKNVWLPYGE
ncbi:aldehyde dehydrogenase (NAD+) [Amaricoccus macauensis]|uniref:Aldehyde dehydrogenase (NAD+) n=1 Tax=Amaricoccus macauensis TaxID=57001 RepID=A0A840SQN2_9RHOB|nr:aldehyde dehydrogenase (NAD+) [Amaricoccus macauensis]